MNYNRWRMDSFFFSYVKERMEEIKNIDVIS